MNQSNTWAGKPSTVRFNVHNGYDATYEWRGISWAGDDESFCCGRAPRILTVEADLWALEFPGVELTEANAVSLLERAFYNGHLDEALDEGRAEWARDMAEDRAHEDFLRRMEGVA